MEAKAKKTEAKRLARKGGQDARCKKQGDAVICETRPYTAGFFFRNSSWFPYLSLVVEDLSALGGGWPRGGDLVVVEIGCRIRFETRLVCLPCGSNQ